MRYIWQHISTIIATYNGSLPLSHFLKAYFKQQPKLGSRDRKILNAMAYSWYRSSKGLGASTVNPEIIQACLAQCGIELPHMYPPGEQIDDNKVHTPFDSDKLLAVEMPLSAGISRADWLQSMLVQPDLFIRIRKDKGKLISLLNNHQIPVTYITDSCLGLPNGAKIDTLLPEDCYVVQDASSQQTGTFFHPKKNESWYDCCSGAGGKSLLLKDIEPGVRLTISDKRESIIHNLKLRFRQYRHELPVAHVTDVANKAQFEKAMGSKLFDNIICDAPCSGSGTWARTPEQLYFFEPATINEFSALQTTIAVNAAGHLKPGGRLIYITCSVFRQENEDVVAAIQQQVGMEPEEQQLINGIGIKADSMFVAVLRKL